MIPTPHPPRPPPQASKIQAARSIPAQRSWRHAHLHVALRSSSSAGICSAGVGSVMNSMATTSVSGMRTSDCRGRGAQPGRGEGGADGV